MPYSVKFRGVSQYGYHISCLFIILICSIVLISRDHRYSLDHFLSNVLGVFILKDLKELCYLSFPLFLIWKPFIITSMDHISLGVYNALQANALAIVSYQAFYTIHDFLLGFMPFRQLFKTFICLSKIRQDIMKSKQTLLYIYKIVNHRVVKSKS